MSFASEFELQMLDLINAEHAARGIDPLTLELRLNGASEDYSAGADRLSGDTGNDRLTGRSGGDTFVFTNGQDVAFDFDPDQLAERIDLRLVDAITDYDGLMSGGHILQIASRTVIDDV
ncbi:MAG: hypothetical protein AAFZ14_01875 [Pseudomonadota bacterium]